jgi:hypothetical protein
MRAVSGEDHTGATVFVEARTMATIGGMFAFGSARATYYYDLDCRDGEGIGSGEDSSDGLPSCARDGSDFTPHVGWEAEVRLGPWRRREVPAGTAPYSGWFVGARYFAVATFATSEHHALATLGWAFR